MENVKVCCQWKQKNTCKDIILNLKRLIIMYHFRSLKFSNYGVPQIRKSFFIGLRDNIFNEDKLIPKKEYSKKIS